jgi:hypothetical protein
LPECYAERKGIVAKDTLTLVLQGDVSLDDYTRAIGAFGRIVHALEAEIAATGKIDWIVEELQAGSAVLTAKGRPLVEDAPLLIERAVEAYTHLGTSVLRGSLSEYSEAVQDPTRQLLGVLNGRISSVRFETEIDDVEIFSPAEVRQHVIPIDVARTSFGAVRGRIETLTKHDRLRFTLYDLVTNRAITCYMQPGSEEIMREAWGKLAIVEGLIRRDPVTGQPTTIRQVRHVETIEEAEPGSWRKAMGSLPHRPDAISAEDAIRRARDG